MEGNIKRVLGTIPNPYGELAIKNLSPRNEHYNVSSRREALELAFYWDEAIYEDAPFWIQVADAVDGKEKYPDLTIELVDGPAKGKKQLKKLLPYIEVSYMDFVPVEGKENEYNSTIKSAIYRRKQRTFEYEYCSQESGELTKPDFVKYEEEKLEKGMIKLTKYDIENLDLFTISGDDRQNVTFKIGEVLFEGRIVFFDGDTYTIRINNRSECDSVEYEMALRNLGVCLE